MHSQETMRILNTAEARKNVPFISDWRKCRRFEMYRDEDGKIHIELFDSFGDGGERAASLSKKRAAQIDAIIDEMIKRREV